MLPLDFANLKREISAITTLPLDACEPLVESITSKTVLKGTLVVRPGSVSDTIYYVHTGVLRTFLSKNGNEITTEFFFPGTFAGAFTSYLLQRPTALSVEAVQDTTLLAINKTTLEELCRVDMRWNLLGKFIFETEFVKKCERESSFLLDEAKVRYRALLMHKPDIETLVPLNFIASYLGIQPETLSRLRSQKYSQ